MEPKCGFFPKCGGCSSQHIEYHTQITGKRNALAAATGFEDITIIAGKPFHYRNRMDFSFHSKGVGFREKGKWFSIVDVDYCAISNERLNALLKEVRNFGCTDPFLVQKKTGTFRYAVIRTPSLSSSICFVLNEDSSRLGEAIEKIKTYAGTSSADSILIARTPAHSDVSISEDYFVVKGSDMLEETSLGKKFYFSAQGFFQNNTSMAKELHMYVHELLQHYETKNCHLLDLYGGVGTFGIINADLFCEVTIIESFIQCIEAAKKNIEVNAVNNAQAIFLDAKNMKKLDIRPEFVLTDPPRSGMHPKTIEWLNAVKPKVILYISCNIKQLEKELKKFSGYFIKSVALVDMFPQTIHSEAVVELVRRS